MFPPLPSHEALRLAAVRRLQLLDTPSEARFDRLTELASQLLGTPISLVTLVDEHRQWFKSRVGLEATETGREMAFCAHAITSDATVPFVVEDTLLDERFHDNPLVLGDPGIRFYVGQVLHDREGLAVGTLCAIDRRPRRLDEAQLRALGQLAHLVEDELDRRTEPELLATLDASERQKSLILDTLIEGVIFSAHDGTVLEWNAAAERILGLTGEELAGLASTDHQWGAVHLDGSPWIDGTSPAMDVLRTLQPVHDAMMGIDRPDGTRIWLRVNAQPVIDPAGGPPHVLSAFTDVTGETEERSRARDLENALLRSEEIARAGLETLEQGVILADNTGTILRANPAAERILGFTGSALNEHWRNPEWVTYREDGTVLPMVDRPLVRAIMQGTPVIGEMVGWRRQDGERVLVRISCTPNADGAGDVVIAFTDVTAEHLARKLLDATLEMAPVGLAILDTNRSILRCNPAFAAQAGRPVEELVGVDVVSLLHTEHQTNAADIGQQMRDGRRPGGELDQLVVRPDGSEIWVNTHLAVIPDPDRPLAIAATFDVTAKRQMLQELSRFGYLVRHANDIIVIIDASGHTLYTSPSTQRILGYAEDYHHPAGILGLVHPDDLAGAVVELEALIHGTRDDAPFVARVLDSAGTWRHIECVAVNLLDEPAVGGIVLTARDATERERLTQQLSHRALHDTLTDLPNRQLLQTSLNTALERTRTGTRIGLCFIDLDGFKNVNDTLGHAAGDALLTRVADRIRHSIRGGDTAARIGGDEFVIVLDPVRDDHQALMVATRVRDAILELNDGSLGDVQFGASIGLAMSRASDTAAQLLHRADAALYTAKESHNSAIQWARSEGTALPVGAERQAAPLLLDINRA
jgi:diguanylate cyclase (GGDEF)-like protein/PAS domain S-box-containing protein